MPDLTLIAFIVQIVQSFSDGAMLVNFLSLYFSIFVCFSFTLFQDQQKRLGKGFLASVVIGRRYLSAKSSRALEKRAEYYSQNDITHILQ